MPQGLTNSELLNRFNLSKPIFTFSMFLKPCLWGGTIELDLLWNTVIQMCTFYDLLLKLKHKKWLTYWLNLKKIPENITGCKSSQCLVLFASFIFPIHPVSRSLMKTKNSPKLHHLANSVFYISVFRKHSLFCQYQSITVVCLLSQNICIFT